MTREESVPAYWAQANRALAREDQAMAGLIRRYRGMSLVSRGEPFATLARSIVGQQISVKAADAVWARFAAVVGAPDGAIKAEAVLAAGLSGLSDCGLSARKREYLCDLAARFASGAIVPERWQAMGDEEVIADLCAVRGIGRWTAEMFLIFNLLRPDIYPVDDLGLQKAVSLLYFSGERPAPRALAAFGERWRPWRTVATWYLWRSLDPVAVVY